MGGNIWVLWPFLQGSLDAGSDPVPTVEPVIVQRTGSQSGELIPERHQHFADLERWAAYIRGWACGYLDQAPTKNAILKKTELG